MTLTQFKPHQSDLPRLKEPFGRLVPGEPSATMPELKRIIRDNHPRKVSTVGDVVSRETLIAGIQVDLRIIDHISMRKPSTSFDMRARNTYKVRNPAGSISVESWETIKRAMRQEDVLIIVDGEEDLLTLPCIAESPDNSLVLYGQPSQGLVVVTTNTTARARAAEILARMTREDHD
jgi:GTP-dependent dephospho-CoA kinase